MFINVLFLKRYGHFSGINRKVQLKYQPRGRPQSGVTEDGIVNSLRLFKESRFSSKNHDLQIRTRSLLCY